jgi:hypothetical protein
VASSGSLAESFSLLFNREGDAMNKNGIVFAHSLFTSTDYQPFPAATLLQPSVNRPLFVSRGTEDHVVGYEHASGEHTQFLMEALADGVGFAGPGVTGCGLGPLAADAIPLDGVAGGHLVAFSNSRPFEDCSEAALDGPPNEIQIGPFQDVPTAFVRGTDPIASIQLVPRTDGAWLVWQEDGSTTRLPPPIMAARIGAQGQLESDAIEVTSTSVVGPIAADRLGDKLIVAWEESAEPGPPSIVIRVIDENGQPAGTATLPSPGWYTQSGISLLGSPSGQQLLVAFPSLLGDEGRSVVHVARYDCAPG